MGAPNFKYKKHFEIGQCRHKGERGFCDGHFNYPSCLLKLAFFGFIISCAGWKNRQVRLPKGSECPEYVEWGIKWRGKDEYIGITSGGQLRGFQPGVKGPCLFQDMKFTNKEVLTALAGLFDLIPKGAGHIKTYLLDNLHAPPDILLQAIQMASTSVKPKYKK